LKSDVTLGRPAQLAVWRVFRWPRAVLMRGSALRAFDRLPSTSARLRDVSASVCGCSASLLINWILNI